MIHEISCIFHVFEHGFMYVSICINTWYIHDTYMKIYVDRKCLDQSRTEYAINVRKKLDQAYDVARDHLQLAHKRQKNYYDRRTRGKRFKQGESVWLHTPVLEKGVAPKFHEPWTRPFKVKKQLSDVTYEI